MVKIMLNLQILLPKTFWKKIMIEIETSMTEHLTLNVKFALLGKMPTGTHYKDEKLRVSAMKSYPCIQRKMTENFSFQFSMLVFPFDNIIFVLL